MRRPGDVVPGYGVRADTVEVEGGFVQEDSGGHDELAAIVPGQAHDGEVDDGGLLAQDGLDLASGRR
jgi:hypothetical protein